MSTQLFFLHGFLGDPDDWKEVIAHLPSYSCKALSYPFELPSEGILIGYSMGGRIALTSSLPKIVISTHPGLTTTTEKEERWKQDQKWIDKLKTEPLSAFLHEWYSQPLFQSLKAHPTFPDVLKRRLQQNPQLLIDQLEQYSLSRQPVCSLKDTTFMHGALDEKYKALYRKLCLHSIEIQEAGHACHIEQPLQLAKAISSVASIS